MTNTRRIIRTYGTAPANDDELLIFPSRQKYSDSRKLPFVAYHDRLRKLLSTGETFLVVSGYSFSDEHINEILYEALRNNPRLAVAALIHSKLSASPAVVRAVELARSLRNLSVYGPDQACIAGVLEPWTPPAKPHAPPLTTWPFWDDAGKVFTLGNFSALTEFLSVFFTGLGLSTTPRATAASSTTTPSV